jgi:hypothetical protein
MIISSTFHSPAGRYGRAFARVMEQHANAVILISRVLDLPLDSLVDRIILRLQLIRNPVRLFQPLR